MKLVVLAAVAVALLVLSLPASGARGQDEGDLRATVEALATRVSDLELRVALLNAGATEITVVPGTRTSVPLVPTLPARDARDVEVKTHTLTGSVNLVPGDAYYIDDEPCSGKGGYADLRAGAAVVVMDGGGDVLALGRLEAGKVETRLTCMFRFEVSDVPRADFYRIEVANREAPTYSYADLEALKWELESSIGSQ